MNEKFVIRFSPVFVQAPITSLSRSAFKEFGEIIPFRKLKLSGELVDKLVELRSKIIENVALKKKNELTYEQQKAVYGFAVEAENQLVSELGDRFEVIAIMDELNPDRSKQTAKTKIRMFKQEEYPLLNDYLYDAIFIPDGVEPPPYEIISTPELKLYTYDFGKSKGDVAFAAEYDGKIVGAAWARIMNDYGHIDDNIPSVAISVKKDYRGMRIGLQLMLQLIMTLREMKYDFVSLAVQRENINAVKLYIKLGFRILQIKGEEYIMIFDLRRLTTS